MPIKPLGAARYGRLVPLRHADGGWLCQCDCGAQKTVTGSHLRTGRVQSCGCLNDEKRNAPKTHGMRRSRAWVIWSNMVQRCTNPRNTSFADYGARGITVCERWRDFGNFLADMGEPPAGLTLEREQNDQGYEPGNCRWASRAEQALNKRTNRLLEVDGVAKPLKTWCTELGLPYWTVHARLRRGATHTEALSK